MNKFHLYLFTLIAIALRIHAAPLMWLPVKDKEEVGLNMLDRITSLSIGVWSESQTGQDGQETYKTTRDLGVGIEGLSRAANSMVFRLVVANPKDQVHTWIHADIEDDTVFYANAVRRTVPTDTPNVVLGEPIHLQFDFVYDPTIKVPGVRSARAYQIDPETGRTKREVYLDVNDDLVTIPEALIGQALYEIQYEDGSVVLYGADGNMLTPTTVYSMVSVGIRNGIVVKNRDVEISNISSYSGHGDNKFVHLVLDKDREVGFEFKTTEGVYATGIKYRQAGRDHANDPWLEANFENKRDGVMTLEAGNWYIVPLWDKGFSPWPDEYEPPNNGGEKG
ncbi:MAG: hypothetical protein KBD47_02535 [Candidatus Pacebacteria bacterium]|jgi:hypothetical protein|nr:hypothetical protein [Candidatus Paceibacterota bacterium]